jgi:hypothetical protein
MVNRKPPCSGQLKGGPETEKDSKCENKDLGDAGLLFFCLLTAFLFLWSSYQISSREVAIWQQLKTLDFQHLLFI